MNRTYRVTITGKTPLLMHWDNIEWADEMKAWSEQPANAKNSVKGDDRSPAWRWFGCLYHDGEHVAMPADNLMRCLMEGGIMVPVPGGRGGKTFKSQSQSGMMVGNTHWPLYIDGSPVPLSALAELQGEADFAKHKEVVSRLGFSLFVKRAKVTTNKHVRVRPMFKVWSLEGTVVVWDEQITGDILHQILTNAGNYKGLGDWRPGSKTPGSYGMFDAAVKLVK
jgi:hypothetical protein